MSADRNDKTSGERSADVGNETLTVPPNPAFAATLGADSAASSQTLVHSFGDYELLGEIARGGMGVVYKARQISLNRVVALKMILSGRLASDSDVQRFHQEAEAAANLDHSNILPIHDVGDHDGQHYFSMKLVDGGNLSDRVKQLLQDPRAAVALMERIARGVYFAHQRGILHRDLKPANILIDTDGTPYVTDFGLAKKTEADSSLTQSGAIVGTPSYMAPEQARGVKGISTAADVYSLGAILYELLTGRPPFKGESMAQTLRMVEEQEPMPPRRLNPACDPDLEAIALKCLEKDSARRYETAGAMADDMRRWLDGETVSARRASAGRRAMKWVKRNPAVAGLASLCAIVLVGGAGVSSYYAVQAAYQAQLTAEGAERAKESAREAMAAIEETKDAKSRGAYEQARWMRLAGQPGWREQSIELLRKSAELRARPRLIGEPSSDLPALGDLRSEFVLALQRPTTQLIREIPANTAIPVHFSQDGRRLMQMVIEFGESMKTGLRFVDLATGQETSRTSGPVDATSNWAGLFATAGGGGSCYLNGDGTRAVVSRLGIGTVHIHELPSCRTVLDLKDAILEGRKEAVVVYARPRFSPDGSKVAAVRLVDKEAQVIVWDLSQPTAPRVIARHELEKDLTANMTRLAEDSGIFGTLRFAPDSKRLSFVTPDRKAYRVVKLSADTPQSSVDVSISDKFSSAEWHPTANLMAIVETVGPHRARVSLWDVEKKAVRAVCGPERTLDSDVLDTVANIPVAFSPNGQWLAIGGSGSTVQVYDASDGDEVLQIETATAISFGVTRLLWNADNELVTTEFLTGIKVWRIELPTDVVSVPQIRPQDRPVFSPDGRWIAVFAPSGKLSSAPEPGIKRRIESSPVRDRIAVIDRKTNQVLRFLPGGDFVDGGLLVSPDSQQVVLHRPEEVVVFNVAGAQVFRRAMGKANKMGNWSETFFDPAGRLLTFAKVDRQQAKKMTWAHVLWDVIANQSVPGFPEFSAEQLGRDQVMTAMDGSRLLICPGPADMMPTRKKEPEPQVARLFDISSGQLAATVPFQFGADDVVFPARLGPGGRRLISFHMPAGVMRGENANMRDIRLTVHDLTTGDELMRIPNRSKVDHAIDFSADSRLVAVGAEQGYVDLWDIDAKERLFRWQPHGGKLVTHLSIAPDGDIATVAEGEDRLVVLRMAKVRAKLAELGLGW